MFDGGPITSSTSPTNSIRSISLIGCELQSPFSSLWSLNRVAMSNSGGFAVTRAHPDSRFYDPPPIRRQQQQQKQKPVRSEAAPVGSVESEPARAEPEESALSVSKPKSVCSSPTQLSADLTHLDRLIKSVTPFVRAHHLPEVSGRSPGHLVHHQIKYWYAKCCYGTACE